MSKQSVDEKKAAVRSRLFPVQVVKHNGVAIEVKPLRYGRVPEATDFIWEVFTRLGQQDMTRDFVREGFDSLASYLNECVSVPDDPDLTIEDLPFDAIPGILDIFIEQTLKPGNWKALAQGLSKKLGIEMIMPAMSQGMSL